MQHGHLRRAMQHITTRRQRLYRQLVYCKSVTGRHLYARLRDDTRRAGKPLSKTPKMIYDDMLMMRQKKRMHLMLGEWGRATIDDIADISLKMTIQCGRLNYGAHSFLSVVATGPII